MEKQFEYRPAHYFISVFIATFALWVIGAYMSFDDSLRPFYMVPMLLGLMAPFVIAVRLIRKSGRKDQMRDFVARMVEIRRINGRSFTLLLLIMPLSVLCSIAISVLLGGATSQFQPSGTFSFSSGFVPVLLLLMLAAAFEELGWRGYGFESLRQRHSLLSASLLFGVLWSAWHLPLLIVSGSYQHEILQQNPGFALNFFASTVVMGVIISWVCVVNRGSILAAIVFHFVINICQESLSMTQETKVIQTFVLVAAALWIVLANREEFLSVRQDRHEEYER